jgi:hypothetical protein
VTILVLHVTVQIIERNMHRLAVLVHTRLGALGSGRQVPSKTLLAEAKELTRTPAIAATVKSFMSPIS